MGKTDGRPPKEQRRTNNGERTTINGQRRTDNGVPPYKAHVKLFRARIYSPVADPFTTAAESSYLSHDDGFVAVEGDRITGVGAWSQRPPCGNSRQWKRET